MHFAYYFENVHYLVRCYEDRDYFALVSELDKLLLIHVSLFELHVDTKINFTLTTVKFEYVLHIALVFVKNLDNWFRLDEFKEGLLELSVLLA